MLSLRDEFGIVRIFRESRCKDTTSQRGRFGLPLVSLGKFGNNLFSLGVVGFRWGLLGFRVYNIYLYILYLYEERPVPAKGLKCQKSKLT